VKLYWRYNKHDCNVWIILIAVLLLYSSLIVQGKNCMYRCSLQLVSSSDSHICCYTHTLKQTHLRGDVKYVNRPNDNLHLIKWYI
jgi:hypothetical protein